MLQPTTAPASAVTSKSADGKITATVYSGQQFADMLQTQLDEATAQNEKFKAGDMKDANGKEIPEAARQKITALAEKNNDAGLRDLLIKSGFDNGEVKNNSRVLVYSSKGGTDKLLTGGEDGNNRLTFTKSLNIDPTQPLAQQISESEKGSAPIKSFDGKSTTKVEVFDQKGKQGVIGEEELGKLRLKLLTIAAADSPAPTATASNDHLKGLQGALAKAAGSMTVA